MLWTQVSHWLFIPRLLQHWSFLLIGILILGMGYSEPIPGETPLEVAPLPRVSASPLAMMTGEDEDDEVSTPPAQALSAEQMLALMAPLTNRGALEIEPLAQSTSISDGQTCVAMCINRLTGKNLRDTDVNDKYGYQLLDALNSETAAAGYTWKDGGELGPAAWDLIQYKVRNEKTPVMVALNGPEFSPAGCGHIVVITEVADETVRFADPATGTLRKTTRKAMNEAASHPDGNFIFYAVNTFQGPGLRRP